MEVRIATNHYELYNEGARAYDMYHIEWTQYNVECLLIEMFNNYLINLNKQLNNLNNKSVIILLFEVRRSGYKF